VEKTTRRLTTVDLEIFDPISQEESSDFEGAKSLENLKTQFAG
jgi:hypothetical protein